MSENNTLVFKLNVKCTKNPHPKDRSGADQYLNSSGTLSLCWLFTALCWWLWCGCVSVVWISPCLSSFLPRCKG